MDGTLARFVTRRGMGGADQARGGKRTQGMSLSFTETCKTQDRKENLGLRRATWVCRSSAGALRIPHSRSALLVLVPPRSKLAAWGTSHLFHAERIWESTGVLSPSWMRHIHRRDPGVSAPPFPAPRSSFGFFRAIQMGVSSTGNGLIGCFVRLVLLLGTKMCTPTPRVHGLRFAFVGRKGCMPKGLVSTRTPEANIP